MQTNPSRLPLRDLKPLDMPAHQALRSELATLSDDDLVAAVEKPARNDAIVINTRTGIIFDGNGRIYELLRRSRNPRSRISLDMLIPVEYYTPNYSMFPDMDQPEPS